MHGRTFSKYSCFGKELLGDFRGAVHEIKLVKEIEMQLVATINLAAEI